MTDIEITEEVQTVEEYDPWISDDVEIFLSEAIDIKEYGSETQDKAVSLFLEDLWETMKFAGGDPDADDSQVNNFEYVANLEETIFQLNRSRIFLARCLQYFIQTNRFPRDEWSPTVVQKMVAYAYTGVHIDDSPGLRRIHSQTSFDELLAAYRQLPPEIQERAALFIEEYSSNFFQTELRPAAIVANS